ncbi:MAG: hypothetical protein JWM80_4697 [Cyanobacteria bacterium RYN_339]|nr:hypothetical protein [Cyanobacteria bacterium RYN_339]
MRWNLLAAALVLGGCGTSRALPIAKAPQALQAQGALTHMIEACRQGSRLVYDELDADEDGTLSRAEWDKRCLAPEAWVELDGNQDGELAFDEFAPPDWLRGKANRIFELIDLEFAHYDLDGDHKITGPELAGEGAAMLMFDLNADHVVWRAEAVDWWEQFVSGKIGTIVWPACPARKGGPARPRFLAPGGHLTFDW